MWGATFSVSGPKTYFLRTNAITQSNLNYMIRGPLGYGKTYEVDVTVHWEVMYNLRLIIEARQNPP